MPIVRDPQGQIRSWDWLLATLGPLHLERATAAKPGQPVYRLEEVHVVEGPAVQIIRVYDTQGLPLQGVQAVRSWPAAPQLPAWSDAASRWRDRGVHGPTGCHGAAGFGLGTADTYQLPAAGPASVWVADAAAPSDRMDGLGLLASANRLHLDLTFHLVQAVPSIWPDMGGDLLAQASPAAVTAPAPPSPPPVPLPLTGDQWRLLIERLDQIIQVLEEQLEE